MRFGMMLGVNARDANRRQKMILNKKYRTFEQEATIRINWYLRSAFKQIELIEKQRQILFEQYQLYQRLIKAAYEYKNSIHDSIEESRVNV